MAGREVTASVHKDHAQIWIRGERVRQGRRVDGRHNLLGLVKAEWTRIRSAGLQLVAFRKPGRRSALHRVDPAEAHLPIPGSRDERPSYAIVAKDDVS